MLTGTAVLKIQLIKQRRKKSLIFSSRVVGWTVLLGMSVDMHEQRLIQHFNKIKSLNWGILSWALWCEYPPTSKKQYSEKYEKNDCPKEKRKTNMICVYQSTQNRTKNICKARSTCIDTHNSPWFIFAPNRQKRVDNWGKRSKCNWHKNHPDIYHPYLIHHRKSDKWSWK